MMLLIILSAVLATALAYFAKCHTSTLPLPPGPSPAPVIGNIHQAPPKPSMASVPHLGQRVRPCRPSQYAWSIHHLAVNCESCPRASFQAGCHLFGSPSLGDVWRAGNEEFAYPSPTVRRAIQASVHLGIDPTFPTEMMNFSHRNDD